MSAVIKITGKSVIKAGSVKYACISFGVFDNNNELNDAVFAQTESLTGAFAGITDYGMLVFNETNANLESSVTVACVVGGSTVEATTSLGTLLTDSDVGDALG